MTTTVGEYTVGMLGGFAYGSHFVRVNALKTHYVMAGEGDPPVVFNHGGAPGASGETNFYRNIPFLSQYFRCYGLDRVGFGLTDKPAIDYTDRVNLDHLLGFLDTLCLDKVSLIGQSAGSKIALQFAAQHPERVHKVVVVTTGGAVTGASQVPNPGRQAQDAALIALRDHPSRENLRRVMAGHIFGDEGHIADDLQEARWAMLNTPGGLNVLYSRFPAQRPERAQQPEGQPLAERLAQNKTPIIVFAGIQDKISPIENSRAAAKVLPLQAFCEVDQAGHHVQSDQADFFNQKVLEFLRDA